METKLVMSLFGLSFSESLAFALAPTSITLEGTAHGSNVGSGARRGKYYEPQIQKGAARRALVTALSERPECMIPTFRSYSVIEEKYIDGGT